MFPAYAGMIRYSGLSLLTIQSVPHLRGDDPLEQVKGRFGAQCSPPTRG